MMKASRATIRVWANPYASHDHAGRPCGAVLRDPVEDIAYADPHANHSDPLLRKWEGRQFVGARLDETLTFADTPTKGLRLPAANIDTVWTFDKDAIELPLTHYYKHMTQAGSLFAADEASAKLLGVKFVPQEEALAAAKAKLDAHITSKFAGELKLQDHTAPAVKLTLVHDNKKDQVA